MFCVSSLRLRWSRKVGAVSSSSQCRWHDSMRTNWRRAGRFRKITESLATKHVCLWNGRTQHRPQARPQLATHIACTAEFRTQRTSFVEDSVDTLIDVLSTQAHAENQIKDTREHAHTSRHSRANFQRDYNFTNRHPSSLVPFDHHTTSALAIVFEAAVPVTFHRFPRLNYHVCQGLFSFVLVRQCWLNGQIPDCVLCQRVSRSRQSSKSANLLFPPGVQGLLYLTNPSFVFLSQ